MVDTLCVPQHVCQCVERENPFRFQLVGVPVVRPGAAACWRACGSRLAIRAKSSTNPGGRRLGLRFQRVDLEERHEEKFQKCRFLPCPKSIRGCTEKSLLIWMVEQLDDDDDDSGSYAY